MSTYTTPVKTGLGRCRLRLKVDLALGDPRNSSFLTVNLTTWSEEAGAALGIAGREEEEWC